MSNFFHNPKPSLDNLKKVIKFSSDAKTFRYWDNEKSENVNVPMPLKFLVLTNSTKFGGFSDETWKFIWSNEIQNLKTEVLTVRSDNQVLWVWTYYEIKDAMASKWAKYCSVLYAYLNWELVKFELIGSSLSSYIEAKIKAKSFVLCDEVWSAKKWIVEYSFPIFKNCDESVSMEDFNKACEFSEQVEEYFNSRKEYYSKLSTKMEETLSQDKPIEIEDVDVKLAKAADSIDKSTFSKRVKKKKDDQAQNTYDKMSSWELTPEDLPF